MQSGGQPTAMAMVIPMLEEKWQLDHRAVVDLRHLASLGKAGYMAANGIAGKLVKKASSTEPLLNASTFVTKSVINAKKEMNETAF